MQILESFHFHPKKKTVLPISELVKETSAASVSGKIQNMKMLMRILLYCVGLMFLAFGVAFSVNSNLGVSPVNSLPYVISLILKVDLGRCIIGVFITYMIVQIIIKRREYKWINLTQLIFSTIFGYFADFAKGVMHGFVIPTYFGQLLMMAISIVLVAIGVAIYMDVKGQYADGGHDACNQRLLPEYRVPQD